MLEMLRFEVIDVRMWVLLTLISVTLVGCGFTYLLETAYEKRVSPVSGFTILIEVLAVGSSLYLLVLGVRLFVILSVLASFQFIAGFILKMVIGGERHV